MSRKIIKHYLVTFMERNGEKEYHQHLAFRTSGDIHKKADHEAKKWYGEPPRDADPYNGGYFLSGGEVFGRVERAEEKTASDFEVIQRLHLG